MTAKPLHKLIQTEAYQIVYLQLLSVFFLSFIGLVWNVKIAVSLLFGGIAYVLPNLFFVWRVFRYAGAHQMTQFVGVFYFTEMLKLVFSGLLFLLVVKYLPISLLSVLIGFVIAMISFWIICLIRFSKN